MLYAVEAGCKGIEFDEKAVVLIEDKGVNRNIIPAQYYKRRGWVCNFTAKTCRIIVAAAVAGK